MVSDILKKEHLLLVDKPKGITSFDVIRRLRRELGVRKMGHAGTLDPSATGLLIVGVGEGTKELHKLIGLSKVYEARVTLGIRTTTGDMDGEVVEDVPIVTPAEDDIRRVLHGLVGTVSIPAPLYSAIKKEGRPLYKYARAGEKVEPPVREMRIFSLSLLGVEYVNGRTILSLRMDVGSGAYVRSIAEEVGRRLGVPAVVSELRRTSIGDMARDGVHFSVNDARGV